MFVLVKTLNSSYHTGKCLWFWMWMWKPRLSENHKSEEPVRVTTCKLLIFVYLNSLQYAIFSTKFCYLILECSSFEIEKNIKQDLILTIWNWLNWKLEAWPLDCRFSPSHRLVIRDINWLSETLKHLGKSCHSEAMFSMPPGSYFGYSKSEDIFLEKKIFKYNKNNWIVSWILFPRLCIELSE